MAESSRDLADCSQEQGVQGRVKGLNSRGLKDQQTQPREVSERAKREWKFDPRKDRGGSVWGETRLQRGAAVVQQASHSSW